MDRAHCRCGPRKSERGFTLVELLIVIAIIPIIIGALSAGLLAVLSLQNSVSNRLSNSSDSQIVSANYIQDVQAAQEMTTANMATAPGCGAANETQVLGLEWDGFQTVVSYVVVQVGSRYLLERNYCAAGRSTTPTSSAIVSYNMPPPSSSMVSIQPSASSTVAAGGWTPAQPITGVTLNIVEPGSSGGSGGAPFAYTLVAVPSAGAPQGQQGSPTPTTTKCEFALAGTGTYASSLCFIDFSPLKNPANQTSATAPGSMAMTVGIPGGYTLSFTVSITNEASAPISAVPFPTYSDSFMGNANNGTAFYSGVGCAAGTPVLTGSNGTPSCIDPSLYQTGNDTTNTITIGSIQLLDPEGVAATGWQLVSGDAETTDPNEFLTWKSNNNWSLIPNSPSSNVGDACNESVNGNPGPGGTDLTGLNTSTVTCESTWQDSGTPRTGTVMLETPTPTTVSTSMKGAGLEGVFFGLMLPS